MVSTLFLLIIGEGEVLMGKGQAMDYSRLPDNVFIRATKVRDLHKASLIPYKEREPGEPDIKIKTLGLQDKLITRSELTQQYVYCNGKRIKLGAWKENKDVLVLYMMNPITVYVAFIPNKYSINVNGAVPNFPNGYYIVCSDDNGSITRDNPIVIDARFFRKMFRLEEDIRPQAEKARKKREKRRRKKEKATYKESSLENTSLAGNTPINAGFDTGGGLGLGLGAGNTQESDNSQWGWTETLGLSTENKEKKSKPKKEKAKPKKQRSYIDDILGIGNNQEQNQDDSISETLSLFGSLGNDVDEKQNLGFDAGGLGGLGIDTSTPTEQDVEPIKQEENQNLGFDTGGLGGLGGLGGSLGTSTPIEQDVEPIKQEEKQNLGFDTGGLGGLGGLGMGGSLGTSTPTESVKSEPIRQEEPIKQEEPKQNINAKYTAIGRHETNGTLDGLFIQNRNTKAVRMASLTIIKKAAKDNQIDNIGVKEIGGELYIFGIVIGLKDLPVME